MNLERKLYRRVLDGELTEQLASTIDAAEWGDREAELAWDRKAEKEENKNEPKN